jgi:hypothetical protein
MGVGRVETDFSGQADDVKTRGAMHKHAGRKPFSRKLPLRGDHHHSLFSCPTLPTPGSAFKSRPPRAQPARQSRNDRLSFIPTASMPLSR